MPVLAAPSPWNSFGHSFGYSFGHCRNQSQQQLPLAPHWDCLYFPALLCEPKITFLHPPTEPSYLTIWQFWNTILALVIAFRGVENQGKGSKTLLPPPIPNQTFLPSPIPRKAPAQPPSPVWSSGISEQQEFLGMFCPDRCLQLCSPCIYILSRGHCQDHGPLI